jgi:hypothetical protein
VREIVDISIGCEAKAGKFVVPGRQTILRDKARDTIRPTMRLRRAEAERFYAAGVTIVAADAGAQGDQAGSHNHDCGCCAGPKARTYARETIGRPPLMAVNQQQTDAPRKGFASGHGRTPGECFRRAI